MPAKLLAKSAVFSWRLSDDNDDAARPHAGGDSR